MKINRYKSSWKQYNKSLINRGSITFWISKDSIKKWKAKKNKKHFGRPFCYSNEAILTACTLRFIYNLPLRAMQGFINSLFSILKIKLISPSYTQVCRRAKKLSLPSKVKSKKITDIVFDASGLKIYGEGEWKVRTHGYSKRRKWMKIHLGVCPNSQEILLSKLTDNSLKDAEVMIHLLDKASFPIGKVYGDALYDAEKCYNAIWKHKGKAIIPIKKNSIYTKPSKPWLKPRNDQILEIRGLGGDNIARSLWKKFKGYHKRSLIETAFYRWKQMLGSNLKSRCLDNQIIESQIKCQILNKMRLAL